MLRGGIRSFGNLKYLYYYIILFWCVGWHQWIYAQNFNSKIQATINNFRGRQAWIEEQVEHFLWSSWQCDCVKGHHFDKLKAVRVVWAWLRFWTPNVLLQSQQIPTAHTHTQWTSISSSEAQQPGKTPTNLLVYLLCCHLSPLFMPFCPLLRVTYSFIATIPFHPLTASLICPSVYNRNPLHGSTETESLEWEWDSKQGAQRRSLRFMEGCGGARLTNWSQHWSNRWRCTLIMCLEVLPHLVSSKELWSYVSITKGGVYIMDWWNSFPFDPDLLSHLSPVTKRHGDGGGHLRHAWKLTPGANVGFQTPLSGQLVRY